MFFEDQSFFFQATVYQKDFLTQIQMQRECL